MAEALMTFRSTHQALDAEERLREVGVPLDLVPTPRQVSSECGFALLLTDFRPGQDKLTQRINGI